ncbi:MAG TPA: hypothetical protein VGD97_10885 [Lacunisphaera sp.]
MRTVTLADFAGTYENSAVGYHSTTLASTIWPKHPPASSTGEDYRSIDRVRIAVDGKTVRLTFLTWGKVFAEVSYVEGKDFSLSGSKVPLKTAAAARATLGQGGVEMAGMIPVPPVAGAVIQTGQLFLNPKGDIIVRYTGTAGAMVFFIAPVVIRDGKDLVFRRVNEEADRLAGYGGPRSHESLPSNIYEAHSKISKIMQRYQNVICITTMRPDQQFIIKKSPQSYLCEVRLALHGQAPLNAERTPIAGNPVPPDLPETSSLPSHAANQLRQWIHLKPVEASEQDVRINLNGNQVGHERVLVINCGADAKLGEELLQHLSNKVFAYNETMSWLKLRFTYWD